MEKTAVPRIITYYTVEQVREPWLGRFLANGEYLPILFHGPTEDDVKEKCKEFWVNERQKVDGRKGPKKNNKKPAGVSNEITENTETTMEDLVHELGPVEKPVHESTIPVPQPIQHTPILHAETPWTNETSIEEISAPITTSPTVKEQPKKPSPPSSSEKKIWMVNKNGDKERVLEYQVSEYEQKGYKKGLVWW